MVGLVGLEHDVIPAVPETLNVSVPLGVAAPVDPATVAVKVSVAPRTGKPDAEIFTDGVACATSVVVGEAVVGTALYALSPGKVKAAP